MEIERNNIIGIAVISAVVGLGLGYALGKRKKQLEFDEAVDEACAETRELYRQKRIELETHLAEVAQEAYEEHVRVEEAASALATYQGVEQLEEAEPGDDFEFDVPTPVPVPELEPEEIAPVPEPEPKHKKAAYVDKSKPYVVTVDEVLNNEADYANSTLTYYESDDTLTGEGDEILDDRSRLLTVGTNLSNFGELSGDPNVVYVRTDKINMYLEIVKHEGKYSEVVAGLGGNE
jgi:hypothetical protein